jgi:hypothetical protein
MAIFSRTLHKLQVMLPQTSMSYNVLGTKLKGWQGRGKMSAAKKFSVDRFTLHFIFNPK